LYHTQISVYDQLSKCFIFSHRVSHAWKNKIVDGSPATKIANNLQAFYNVFKLVIIGSVLR
jgi:hypothetical protein